MTEPANDIEIGVVLVISECAEHREINAETDAKFRQGLDWELDQFISGAAKGKRCDRIWKDGP